MQICNMVEVVRAFLSFTKSCKGQTCEKKSTKSCWIALDVDVWLDSLPFCYILKKRKMVPLLIQLEME